MPNGVDLSFCLFPPLLASCADYMVSEQSRVTAHRALPRYRTRRYFMYRYCSVLRTRVQPSCRACARCTLSCASRRCSQSGSDLPLPSLRARCSKNQRFNLHAAAHKAGVDNFPTHLQPEQLRQSQEYLKLVLQQNVNMNLTGGLLHCSLSSLDHCSASHRTLLLFAGAANEQEAFVMHIEDSLSLLPVLDALLQSQHHGACLLETRPKILDVGSGAGLPGVILAIARPDWQVT